MEGKRCEWSVLSNYVKPDSLLGTEQKATKYSQMHILKHTSISIKIKDVMVGTSGSTK